MRIEFKQSKAPQFDTLPLINIVFLMLVFFLVAGTIAPVYELDVSPASAKDSEAGELRRPAVFVSRDGKISFGQREVAMDQIQESISAAKLDPQLGLRIAADRDADAHLLLNVITAVQKASDVPIFLVTLRSD